MPAHGAAEEEARMKLRSLLFVPADRPERFAKAAASGADAIILDLEDSVAPERKAYGRDAIAEWLARSEEHTSELQSLMRISYAVFCLKKKKKTHEHRK